MHHRYLSAGWQQRYPRYELANSPKTRCLHVHTGRRSKMHDVSARESSVRAATSPLLRGVYINNDWRSSTTPRAKQTNHLLYRPLQQRQKKNTLNLYNIHAWNTGFSLTRYYMYTYTRVRGELRVSLLLCRCVQRRLSRGTCAAAAAFYRARVG